MSYTLWEELRSGVNVCERSVNDLLRVKNSRNVYLFLCVYIFICLFVRSKIVVKMNED